MPLLIERIEVLPRFLGFTCYVAGREPPEVVVMGGIAPESHVSIAVLNLLAKRLKDSSPKRRIRIVPLLNEFVYRLGASIDLRYRYTFEAVYDAMKERIAAILREAEVVLIVDSLPNAVEHTIVELDRTRIHPPTEIVVNSKPSLPPLIPELEGKDFAMLVLNEASSANDLEHYVDALLDVLAGLGVVKRKSSKRSYHTYQRIEYVRTPVEGVFIPSKRSGEQVVENEVLGMVDDVEVRAPCNGILLFHHSVRYVVPGTVLASLACSE